MDKNNIQNSTCDLQLTIYNQLHQYAITIIIHYHIKLIDVYSKHLSLCLNPYKSLCDIYTSESYLLNHTMCIYPNSDKT